MSGCLWSSVGNPAERPSLGSLVQISVSSNDKTNLSCCPSWSQPGRSLADTKDGGGDPPRRRPEVFRGVSCRMGAQGEPHNHQESNAVPIPACVSSVAEVRDPNVCGGHSEPAVPVVVILL